MAACLYHDDKLQFDIVAKDILHAKLLPRSCAHRLGMAVCSCRRNRKDITDFVTDAKLPEVVEYVRANILNRQDLPTNLRSFLDKLLLKNISLSDYSACKFVSVLYDSVAKSTYDQLSREATNSKPAAVVEAEAGAKGSERKKKMQKKQYDLMVKKKMSRKDRITHATLPMFPRNIQKMRQDPSYKKMRETFGKSVFVQFCDKENTRNITDNKNETILDVYAKEKKDAERFISGAQAHARKLQEGEEEKRKICIEKRKAIKRARADRRDMPSEAFNLTEMALEIKENLAEEHERSHKKTSDVPVKKTNQSSLDGGHCLSCLAPFQGLHPTSLEEKICTYHPGFIQYKVVKEKPDDESDSGFAGEGLSESEGKKSPRRCSYVWSCCGEESVDQHPMYDAHRTTGCTTGVHSWRQNKKQLVKVSVRDDHDIKSSVRALVKHGQSNSARDVLNQCDNYA